MSWYFLLFVVGKIDYQISCGNRLSIPHTGHDILPLSWKWKYFLKGTFSVENFQVSFIEKHKNKMATWLLEYWSPIFVLLFIW